MTRLLMTLFFGMFLTACYTQSPNAGPPLSGAQMCGGLMGAICANPDEYCQYSQAAQCGAADQTGVCSPRPQICTQEYAPMCGCDGLTYGNVCTAAGNGASVAYVGECRR